jgi:2-methylisocitrate lyase-like PEP mutase family enzyme
MLAKLKVAISAKQTAGSPHFILNARTDALRALDDRKAAQVLAIERANSYLGAGADLCFIPYIQTRKEVALFAKEVKGPLSVAAGLPYNIKEFSINDCRELGIARVSLPTCLIFSAIQGMLKILTLVRDTGNFTEAVRQEMIFSDTAVLEELLHH